MTTTWREELAWAAGFFDGEGWIGTQRSKALRVPRLTVTQKDLRALERFRSAVGGIGHIYHDPGRPTKRSAVNSYQASSLNHVQTIVALLWTWLGPVKREQARRALGIALPSYRLGPKSPRQRDHCKRGHLYAVDTLLSSKPYKGRTITIRRCRQCIRHLYLVRRTAQALLSA